MLFRSGVLEILQSFTETRQGDWADEGADALGALLALALAYAGVGGGWRRSNGGGSLRPAPDAEGVAHDETALSSLG